MKRRIITTGLLIALAFGSVYAQTDRALKKADKKYSLYSYADAVVLYEALYDKNPSDALAVKAADCHFKMNELSEAKQWYDKIEDKKSLAAEHHLHYGNTLESVGDYDQAAKWYKIYKAESNETRGKRKHYGATNVSSYFRDSARYSIEHLPINTKYSDFSPAYFEDGIVFASARVHEVGSQHTFKWDNTSFLDLYYSRYDSVNNDYSKPDYFNSRLNTKFHEGPLSFDGTNDKVIFTRNNYFKSRRKKSDDKVVKLKMYYTERQAELSGQHGWSTIKAVSYTHLTLPTILLV